MKRFTASMIAVALVATSVAPAFAGERWHHHHDRVIIERQPTLGLGVGIGALLLLQQLGQQKQYAAEQYEPAPQQRRSLREPKLRDNPVPLK